MSAHATKGVNCLDCHQPTGNQQKEDHHGFVIAKHLTAGNCRGCHEAIYQEFLRSRHAAPSWAAIYGEKGLTPEQVTFSETYQPGGTRRPPHPFVKAEGGAAMTSGCDQCHAVGAGLWDKLVNGAPPLAPQLFPNLVALAWIGMWALTPHLPEPGNGRSLLGTAYAWARPGESACS
jgi:hypothetical protein